MPIEWVPTLSGLTATAVAFSEKEDYDFIQEPAADVKLRVPWSQRHAVGALVMGLQWPYYTTVPMYAVHIGMSPIPSTRCLNDGFGNTYAEAYLDVHFDPFTSFTESIKTNGEMLKVSRVGVSTVASETQFMLLVWDKGTGLGEELGYETVALEEAPSKIIVGLEYEVSFENLDEVPSEVLELVDCCNDDTVTPINLAGLTFAAETLMLMSADIKHTVSVDGSVKNSLTLKFGWRKNGWNKYWRASTQAWSYQYVIPILATDLPVPDAPKYWDPDPDGPPPAIYRNFPMADFSPLLPTP